MAPAELVRRWQTEVPSLRGRSLSGPQKVALSTVAELLTGVSLPEGADGDPASEARRGRSSNDDGMPATSGAPLYGEGEVGRETSFEATSISTPTKQRAMSLDARLSLAAESPNFAADSPQFQYASSARA